MYDVEVTFPITLGQFVKLANLAETGGQARELINAGFILLNGEEETRRGKKLSPGDIVALDTENEYLEVQAVEI